MSEWISVCDYFPQENTGVLAANDEQVGEMFFYRGGFICPYADRVNDEYDIAFIKSITHWMPLPEPPNV